METVLITGASRRLGSRIAENLAADSCFVWIHYLTHREEAFDLRSKILSSGGQAECIQCDLCIPDQIDHMLKTISDSENGQLTALINNASLFLQKTLQKTDADEWDQVLNTNLKAVWYLSNRFAKNFPSARKIITIGDANISNRMAQHAVYALSKHALKFLTEQMAMAYAPKISVNLLSPGLVMKGDDEPDSIWDQRQKRALRDNHDIVAQVTNGVSFLMNDPGMTGAELIIDNGAHLFRKNDNME